MVQPFVDSMSGEQAWLNVCPHDFPSKNSSNWLPLMPGQTLATEGIYADPKIFVLGAGYSRHIMKLCQVFDLSHGDNLLKSFKADAFDAWCWPNVGSLIRTATLGKKSEARPLPELNSADTKSQVQRDGTAVALENT